MKGVFGWEELGGFNAWVARKDTRGYAVATIWRFFVDGEESANLFSVQMHIDPTGPRIFPFDEFYTLDAAKLYADKLLRQAGYRFLPDELKVLL